jgi:hypothetical protein
MGSFLRSHLPPATTTISPIAAYYNREYDPSSYTDSQGQQQQHYLTKDSFKQGYMDMLREESEKLFTGLEKTLIDEVIDQYVSKTSVAMSLPVLRLDDEEQQQQKSSPS